MTTTTIRIEEKLKTRIAVAADRAGKTAHAFILDAIAQTLEQAELDNDFHDVADERWHTMLASGKTVSWEEAKTYLAAKSRGESPGRPTARKPD